MNGEVKRKGQKQARIVMFISPFTLNFTSLLTQVHDRVVETGTQFYVL
jgi:hypothetical protein